MSTANARHRPQELRRERKPYVISSRLASVTCTYERIRHGVALAQVGVVTSWAGIYISWTQRFYRERWKRHETLRLANARQTKYVNGSQPPLHVDIMYAATVHAFFPERIKRLDEKAIRSGKGQRVHVSRKGGEDKW